MGFMPCMKVPMLKPEKLLRNQLFTHFIIYYVKHSIKAKEHIVKRVIYLLILMSDLIYAATATAEYDIDFSVAGTVAKASMQKVQEGDAYTITLQAHAVGSIAHGVRWARLPNGRTRAPAPREGQCEAAGRVRRGHP